MDIKEKLDTLVAYERIDAPSKAKERYCWKAYTSEKIVNFLGARELTLVYGFVIQSIQNRVLPNVYSMVAQMLE